MCSRRELELIGREGKLRTIAEFLDAGPRPASALLLDGPAGIGKTTLWLECVRLARASGCLYRSRDLDSVEDGE